MNRNRVRACRGSMACASALLLAAGVAAPAQADDGGIVIGHVQSVDGIALSDAQVDGYDSAGRLILGAETDAAGNYVLRDGDTDVPDGEYTIQVSPHDPSMSFQHSMTDDGPYGPAAATHIDYAEGTGPARSDFVIPYHVSGARAPGAVNPSSRTEVISAYRHRLLPALQVKDYNELSVRRCTAPHTSLPAQRATVAALNFYRALVGLDPVTLDTAAEADAHQSSVIQQANWTLNHYPPPSYKCYTQRGAAAAGRSSLSRGATGGDAISNYIQDFGSNNLPVGHRRDALAPSLISVGTSDVGAYNSLFQTFSNAHQVSGPAYVEWPTPGYFPVELEPFGRWSITAAQGQDLSAATVEVTGVVGVSASRLERDEGNLTFQVRNLTKSVQKADRGATVTLHVQVSGIRHLGIPAPNVGYNVRLIRASASSSATDRRGGR